MFSYKAGIILFFFLPVIACNNKKEPPPKQPPKPVSVEIIIAAQSQVDNTIEVNGTAVANEFAELHPEISGRLTYLNVPEGAYLKKGTLVARINDADLRAQLNKSKAALQLAEKTQERLSKLMEIKGLNQADYDVAVNQVISLRSDIAYTQAQIEKTYIRAPFSGVAGLRQVSPGAYVTPSTIISTIQQVDKVKIDFTVPEEHANLIKKGLTIMVESTGSDGSNKNTAVVVAVEPQANLTTRNLKVRAVVPRGNINPGSFVKVYLNASNRNNAIMVPTNAVIPDAQSDKVILVKNGKASFSNIETGIRQSGTVEILKGVQPGDSVIVTGVLFARQDAPVTVSAVKKLNEVVVE